MKKFACLIFAFSLIATAACSGGSSSGDGNEIEGLNPAGNDNPFGDRIPIPFPGGGNDDDPNPDPDPDPNPNPNPDPDPDPVPDPNPDPGNNGALEFNCLGCELPRAIVGQPYEYKIRVVGGSGEYVFSKRSGFSAGFDLDGDTITGMPVRAGDRSFKVKVKDSRTNRTARCQFSLTIKETIKVKIRRIDQTPAEPIGDVENPGRFDFSRFIGSNRWQDIANTNPQLGGTLNQPAPWDTVYELSVEGTQRGSNYTWAWGHDVQEDDEPARFRRAHVEPPPASVATWLVGTSNVCFSITRPDLDNMDQARQGCTAGNPPEHGKVVYAWLKEDLENGAEHRLPFSITGDLVNEPASGTLKFRYPDPAAEPSEGTGDEGDALSRATRVTIFTRTSAIPTYSGTECAPHIKFCKDVDGLKDDNGPGCTRWFNLREDDYNNFKNGENDWTFFTEDMLDSECRINEEWCLTKDHKYFTIKLRNRRDCEPDDDWMLSELKVEIEYADGSEHKHYDPCLNKRMLPGDSRYFTPEDTAVCATILTGERDGAGTDDDVYLVFNGADDYDYGSKTSLSNEGPRFVSPDEDNHILMLLYWDWTWVDLFSYGSVHSFSDYLDNFPFEDPPEFKIEKAPDGESGGWFLQGWKVYVYRPGKILNGEDEAVYCHKAERFQEWLHEGAVSDSDRSDDPLSTRWYTMEDDDSCALPGNIGDCTYGCRLNEYTRR